MVSNIYIATNFTPNSLPKLHQHLCLTHNSRPLIVLTIFITPLHHRWEDDRFNSSPLQMFAFTILQHILHGDSTERATYALELKRVLWALLSNLESKIRGCLYDLMQMRSSIRVLRGFTEWGCKGIDPARYQLSRFGAFG